MMSYNNSTKKQLDIINPDYEHNQFNWKTYNNYRLLSSTFSKLVTHNKCADDESEFCYKLYLWLRLKVFNWRTSVWFTKNPNFEFLEGLQAHYHIISDEHKDIMTNKNNET